MVHSNANPYAGAAMAVALGRSQEAGPYFQLSETFIPMIEGLAAVDVEADAAEDPIVADFENDCVQHLRNTGLPACGLTYDDVRTPHEITMRFLNANNRRIPSRKPRAIHESAGDDSTGDFNLRHSLTAGSGPFIGITPRTPHASEIIKKTVAQIGMLIRHQAFQVAL